MKANHEEKVNVKNSQIESIEGVGDNKTKKNNLAFGILLVVVLIVSFTAGLTIFKKEAKLNLNELMAESYSIIDVEEDEAVEEYSVVVQMDAEPEVVSQLAAAIEGEIARYEKKDFVPVKMYVYSEAPESLDSLGDVKDESFKNYVEVSETVKVTSWIHMGDLEGNAVVSEDWKIEDAKRQENGLVGSVTLVSGLDNETVFVQLKGLADEMGRFNELSEDASFVFTTTPQNSTTYDYNSSYSDKLFVTKEFVNKVIVEQ